MTAPAPSLDLSRSGPWLLALLVLALVAFWPTYLSLGPAASSAYTHLHAVTATAWMLLLIAQPIALRRRRFALHRTLGRLSFGLAPLFVVAVLLLAHDRIRGLDGQAFAIQSYVLYLQLSLAAVFALSWALAIAWRRRTAWHARFMICTALTLVDPVVIRLMFWVQPIPAWNYQWLTFGLTDALLVLLIWLERRQPAGRGVFPAMLAVFVASQLPALLGGTAHPAWQAFARWVAEL